MKPRLVSQTSRALTRVDVIVLIAAVLFLAIIFVAAFINMDSPHDPRYFRINCVSNLKQVDLASRIWAGDHNNKYPTAVYVTNGGVMELINGRNAWINFTVMSNELSVTRILHCPADTERAEATNFNDLEGKISYFFNLDADETRPEMFSGDDNFAIAGVPVKSGLLEFSSRAPISWTAARHIHAGNIVFADGSVQELSNLGLQQTLQQTGVATNRLAIP